MTGRNAFWTARVRIALAFAFVLCGYCSSAHAELEAALQPPQHATIASAALHEERLINVFLPQEASGEPDRRFDTIYVLDGEWEEKFVVNTVDFLHQHGFLPPVIVVSIPNIIDGQGGRSRDSNFTPSIVKSAPRSGGATAFLDFLGTELIPYVDAHYPTSATRTLFGHSLGGLFVAYALVERPELFAGYVAADPAFQWDDHWINAPLKERLGHVSAQGKAVFFAGRAEPVSGYMGLDAVQAIFRESAPGALEWTLVTYDGETHNSMRFKAIYDALKYLYAGYSLDPVEVVPLDGVMVRGWPLTLAVFGERVDMHYTLDGSTPTRASAKYDESGIKVADPIGLRLKTISTRGAFDRDWPVQLRFGEFIAPLSATSRKTVRGAWGYKLFRADEWPALKHALPGRTGKVDELIPLGQARVAGEVRRDIQVPADGYYIFLVDSNAARLSIGGTEIVAKNEAADKHLTAFVAPLRAGAYPLSFSFLTARENGSVYLGIFQYRDDQPRWWTQQPWLEVRGR